MAVREFDRARGGVIESRSGACRRPVRRAGSSVRVAGLALVGALTSLLVLGCQSRPASTQSGSDVRLPDQEARDFTLTESLEGRKNWTLWASYAAMYNDQSLVDAKTVRIEFFDKEGKKFSTLVARQGRVHQRTNDLEARGNVVVTTESGIRMETDSLRWQNRVGKIVSDGFVKVTRKNDVVTGYGFESDPSLDHFHLRREVRAEVRDTGGDSL
jgi:lipopolysaccharide export system protein LptC